jgi:hypothetical protein
VIFGLHGLDRQLLWNPVVRQLEVGRDKRVDDLPVRRLHQGGNKNQGRCRVEGGWR